MGDIELRQLRFFVTVAEESSFRRAAERLKVTEQALGHHVGRLERELETELLHRSSKGVELTAAGTVLFDEGRRVLSEADRARTAVSEAARGELGTLRVGFVSTAAI